jgi:hypothetical protein
MTYEDMGYSTNPDWPEFDELVAEFASIKEKCFQFDRFISWVRADEKTRLRQMAEKLREITGLARAWEEKENDKNSR